VPRERRFDLPGLTLAAEIWGEPGARPIIAAHGWLDNAGSFDLLAPLLPGNEIVALDLAGHGKSGSRSADSAYNLWQDAGDVLDVANALGWQRFTLLGHSRGAGISMLFAGTFPERVDKLVLLEGGLPVTAEPAEAPAGLAQALLESRALREKGGRVFKDRETAIAERAGGFSKVTTAAAEILARRSLREVPGGYQWHADQRLKAQSELRLTAEQTRAFARRITAPALVLFAEKSPFADRPLYREFPSWFANVEVERIPGAHHFHLEGSEAAIAERIRRFLDSAR
jgi:pimeloyl-ACP methyl ester carboxylesterase